MPESTNVDLFQPYNDMMYYYTKPCRYCGYASLFALSKAKYDELFVEGEDNPFLKVFKDSGSRQAELLNSDAHNDCLNAAFENVDNDEFDFIDTD